MAYIDVVHHRTFVTVTGCDPNNVTSLSDCTDTEGCSSGHYATVYCSHKTLYSDEIVVSVSNSQLWTTLGGQRVAVCKSNWTDTEANITCTSLGYDGGIAAYNENPLLPVLFGNFNCNGTETSIAQCLLDVQNTGCSEPSSKQLMAGVRCYRSGQVPNVSMDSTDYDSDNEGNALVTINGVTHTICGDTWGNGSAQVFCRELGFTSGSAITLYEEVNNTRVLSHNCRGDEKSLFLCNFIELFKPCLPAAARCYKKEIRTTNDVVTLTTSSFVNQTFSGLMTQTNQSHSTTTSSPREEVATTGGELGDTEQHNGLNDKDVLIIASSVLGGVVLCLGVLVVILIKKRVVNSKPVGRVL